MRLPAFIFYEAAGDCCKWIYLGLLKPKSVPPQEGDRVSPFYFERPSQLRAILPPLNGDHVTLEQLSKLLGEISTSQHKSEEDCHPAIPALTEPEFKLPSNVSEVLAKVVSSISVQRERLGGVLDEIRPERLVWEAVTHAVFDLRSEGKSESEVESVLIEFARLVSSRWFPVHLPTIEPEDSLYNLHTRWVCEALLPLNHHWENIRCPDCASKNVTLTSPTLSANGTIEADLRCSICGTQPVPVLTHCFNCGHDPLIIGKNKICPKCKRLRCDWSPDTNTTCDHCKKGCDRIRATQINPVGN